MERVLEERSRQLILPPVEEPTAEPPQPKRDDLSIDAPPAGPRRLTPSQLRRQRRLERYEQVVALFNAGQSQKAISRALGIQRKTIRRWLRRGEFPERKPPHRPPPKVSEFADFLQQRWNDFGASHGAGPATVGGEYGKTRARRSSKPARPYIWRLIVLSRLIWPSTWPVLQAVSTAAATAEISFCSP